MWIFAKDGFLSIIEDRSHPGHLLVRARVKGDIEHYFPNAKVERTEKRDYLYRTSLPREEVARCLHFAITSIDYDNFKDSVTYARKPHYIDVWTSMTIMQEFLDRGA